MTVQARKQAFSTISSAIAITRYDIEQHQSIGDLSLNIHGENFFRDVFNFVYCANYQNANTASSNAAYIDLVDHSQKKFIQITTTRSQKKVKDTLKVLLDPDFKGYSVEVYYLLEKSNIQKGKIKELEREYKTSLADTFKDYRNLIKDIDAMDEPRLIQLADTYFSNAMSKYSKEQVLNIVCEQLVQEVKNNRKRYNEPLSNTDVNSKIDVNELNERVALEIRLALDFSPLISDMEDSKTATELQTLVVDEQFREVLIKYLRRHFLKAELIDKNTFQLQQMAKENNICFSMLIDELRLRISELTELDVFAGMKIPWIIVAFYFELCLVGRETNDIPQ